jgi:hypothetical protein
MKLFKRKMGKKMKAAINALADGIECGAKLRPQATGNLAKTSEGIRTCALGAALECQWIKQGKQLNLNTAAEFKSAKYDDILLEYGIVNRPLERLIVVRDVDEDQFTVSRDADICGLIWQLNDKALWTREQIAAFLRDLE